MNYEIIFNLIELVVVIIASCTAIYGINSWRREAKWKKKFELAEEVLGLFYEAKEGIDRARFPGSFVGEGSTRNKNPNESEKEAKILNMAYIPIERLNKISGVFLRLKALKFKFMAVYDRSLNHPFEELEKIRNEILFASNQLGSRYWNEHHINRIERLPKRNQDFDMEQTEINEKVIWASSMDKDEITERLKVVIKTVEKECSKVLIK